MGYNAPAGPNLTVPGSITATNITAGGITSTGTIVGAGTIAFANGLGVLNEFGGSTTNAGATLWFINGAPNVAMGSNGDFALRFDGTAAAHTLLYHKEGGAWVASAA